MNNPRLFYRLLLQLYPARFRRAFGAQMLQTFLDHLADVRTTEGRVPTGFWLSVVVDELRGVTVQHFALLREDAMTVKITGARIFALSMFALPLFAVFYASLVRLALMLPHPHVNGPGAVAALAMLALVPATLSLILSFHLANRAVSLMYRRRTRPA